MSQPTEAPKNVMQKFLALVEKVGNQVPLPAVIFLLLIALVVVLSALFGFLGTSVTYEVLVPKTQTTEAPTDYDASVQDSGTAVTYQTLDEHHYVIETRS